MSAAAEYFRTGELEAVACCPEVPTPAEHGLSDGVRDLYQRMANRGELFQAGRRFSTVRALLRNAMERWGLQAIRSVPGHPESGIFPWRTRRPR